MNCIICDIEFECYGACDLYCNNCKINKNVDTKEAGTEEEVQYRE